MGSSLIEKSIGEISVDDIFETLGFHRDYQPICDGKELSEYLRQFAEIDWVFDDRVPVDTAHAIAANTPPSEMNWTYVIIGLQNTILTELVDEYGYHHCCLQAYYKSYMPVVQRLVQKKLGKVLGDYFDEKNEPSGLILLGFIEQKFQDKTSCTKATEWLEWLTKGRVPCGWAGDFPSGRLIVW